MLNKSGLFGLMVLLLISQLSQGQSRLLEPFEAKQGFLTPISFSFQNPQGDLADRFGRNNAISIGFEYKTKSNWSFGSEFNWMFSNNVNEVGMLDSLVGNTGILIDQQGSASQVTFEQRGFTLFGSVARTFSFTKNRNSGIYISAGAGYMRHHIDLVYANSLVPQLGDYEAGYDRLTGGMAFKGFFGYQHLDPNLRLNLRIGYEYIYGHTQSLRPFNYDTRMKDDRIRQDILRGMKISLVVPFYTKKNDDEFFFE
jgi:hypothetical protein